MLAGLQLIAWSCVVIAIHACFGGVSFPFALPSLRGLTLPDVLRQSLPTVALAAMGWLYRLAHRAP